jgi:hypothetical protein
MQTHMRKCRCVSCRKRKKDEKSFKPAETPIPQQVAPVSQQPMPKKEEIVVEKKAPVIPEKLEKIKEPKSIT